MDNKSIKDVNGNGADLAPIAPEFNQALDAPSQAPQFITQTNRHPETGELVTGEDAHVSR